MYRKTWVSFAAIGLVAAVACDGGPLAPKWDIQVFFPLRFPDVDLQNHAPGGLLPPFDVAFTDSIASKPISNATEEILSQDIKEIEAHFIFATTSQIAGSLDLTFAPVATDLFSADPDRAVTLTIPMRQTLGDTPVVSVPPALLTQATTVFLQSRGTLRSATGAILTLGPGDIIQLRVNLIARLPLVK